MSKGQLADWGVLFGSVAVGLLLVMAFYPIPEVISDSIGYLLYAQTKQFLAYRPIGYSLYLCFIHWFSRSMTAVVISQALIYTVSLGMLLLAVKKYWPPRRKSVFFAVEALTALCPTCIFMIDTILSDTLLCSLVFVMVTMVIVMIQERSWIALIVFEAALYAALFTRYSAMFFPIAFVPIFAMNGKAIMRIASIALTAAVFLTFHTQLSNYMSIITGKPQFSTGFDGWQLANNAMHVLPYIDPPRTKLDLPRDPALAQIHTFSYFNFKHKIKEVTNDGKKVTAYFLWDRESPLKLLLIQQLEHSNTLYQNLWVRFGSVEYKNYGKWLILKYPGKFIRYYLLPNSKSAFYPYHEVVFNYSNVEAGKKEIVNWFDFPEDKPLEPRSDGLGKIMRPVLPWFDVITWLIFIASALVLFFRKNKEKLPRESVQVLLMIFLFGLIYYGTTVFASPIAIRYWMPMYAIKVAFAWIALQCAGFRWSKA